MKELQGNRIELVFVNHVGIRQLAVELGRDLKIQSVQYSH